MNPYYEIYPEIFEQAHQHELTKDGKAIADAIPNKDLTLINHAYENTKAEVNFDFGGFFKEHFTLPKISDLDFESDRNEPLENHIKKLWAVLTRQKDTLQAGSSLMPLPHAYVVPGGRFNEVYYWDSYFTMLGLEVHEHLDLIESMVDNFSHLIHTLGYIPNGNRAYYVGRSQPPFYSHMVRLLADAKPADDILQKYLPYLIKEFDFFTQDSRKVAMDDTHTLYVYGDSNFSPRIEMYKDDIDLALKVEDKNRFYNHIRAACESGWDFSSRWMLNANDLASIHTTDIVPLDLNALLYHLALTISEASQDKSQRARYLTISENLKAAILAFLWSEKSNCFYDYDTRTKACTGVFSAAAFYPLFVGIATLSQAQYTADKAMKELLHKGGLACTSNFNGQQWDAPNGWAPLQWTAVKGLLNYGFIEEAKEIATKWCKLNEAVFKRTGKMMEKYNVVDIDLEAGGGEYPVQDGFGWSNGVYLKLKRVFSVS